MSSKIILINGPRECGKNVAVDYIKRYIPQVVDRRCKDKLFELTQAFFCISAEDFFTIYNNRELKELPNERFRLRPLEYYRLYSFLKKPIDYRLSNPTISVRDALIYVSELICKPAFGKDYFGVARANSILDGELAIDDSCGFDDEIPPTLEKLGADNVLLIRICGRGDFAGDSRKFISDGVVPNTLDVDNTLSESEYLRRMLFIVYGFYRPSTLSEPERIYLGQSQHWGDNRE